MPHRRAFRDILSLIRHFLESKPDYFSASQIGERISADQRVVERHLDVLKELGHTEEKTGKAKVRLVRWKRIVR